MNEDNLIKYYNKVQRSYDKLNEWSEDKNPQAIEISIKFSS